MDCTSGSARLDDGEVATYIPELAKADPRWFGICIATVDGHVYEVGDTRQPFTIQSISKPFVYGLALEDRGKPAVLERIGVEPTGDAFNEISLEAGTGRPLQPDDQRRRDRRDVARGGPLRRGSAGSGSSALLLALRRAAASRSTRTVYRSERDTGHRNRAIGHMLRNFDDPGRRRRSARVDLYFRQCSIEVTCRDLAVMAATLANGGMNPVTRERALDPRERATKC